MLKEVFNDYLNLTLEVFKKHDFTADTLTQLACEYAFKMSELEENLKLKEKELELKERELEVNLKLSQTEALKSIVQAESMIKSVRDNALIAKANAYVGFLNVVLNAQNVAANDKGSTHQNNVIITINAIGTKANGALDELEGYSQILLELKDDVLEMTQ